jgi:hypothetical protein
MIHRLRHSGPGEGFGAPKEGKKRAKGDFRGIKLSNKTHRSGTDHDALLCRKSKAHPALPSYRGHVLMDNRHALIVNCRATQATGTGERDAAKAMAADIPGAHRKTLGADKNYDTKGMVADLRWIGVAPYVAQNTSRPGGSAIDGRTTRHEGYAKSINARRGIEKGVWLDQTVRRPAPVQAARHRKGQCGVWPTRGRLQLDPTRQPAQAGEGGGTNQVVAQRCGQALASGERQRTEIGAAGALDVDPKN